MKTLLSYSAIDGLYKSPHSWINKLLGIQTPVSEAMQRGKDTHKIIQDHVSGIKRDDRLKDLTWEFQKAEHHARKLYNDEFDLHGYLDAINFKNKVFLEVKSSGKTLWSQGKFNESIQPLYYSYVSGFTKVLFVTCTFDFSQLKTYYREFDPKEWVKAEEWVKGAISIINKGDFKSDLIEGKCMGCNYRENCYFI